MARQPAKTSGARKAPARPRRKSSKPADAKPAGAASAPEQAANPEPPPSEKPKRHITVTSLEQSSTKLRVVLLNLAFVAAFLLLVPVIASQFWQSDVVIEPISVPDNLVAVGMTADVVASRLWDGLQDAEVNAKTSKSTVTAVPTSKRIKFSIPETGVSIESLVNQTRLFFNAYQTRVAGEFICANAECKPEEMQLRLRVIRDKATVIDLPPIGTTGEREYFTEAGVQVLSVLDPFVAISATAEREPLKAVTLARHLIRSRHPDAHWAYNLIGNIRSNAKEHALAAAEYRAAIALKPDFTIAKTNLATTLIDMGELDEARDLLTSLQAANPKDSVVRMGFAELAVHEGKPNDAVALLVAAAGLSPNDPQYLARAGQIEIDNGKLEEARKHLEQALAIDPSFAPALGTLGHFYLAQGDYVAAEPLFGDMAEFLPDDVEAQDLHGQTLMLIGQPDLAATRFEKAVALEPQNVDHLVSLSRALFFLDRLPESRIALEKGLTLAPDRADIYASLGQLDLLGSDTAAALVRYEKAAELDPANPDYVANVADALFYLGRVPEAITRLEGLTRTAPQRIETWFSLGSYYGAAGRSAESITAYENFLTLAPALPMFETLRTLATENLARERDLVPAAEEASAP